jgi:large subunit ribosomal protein L21
MYAVIRTGGKQYRVAPGDVVKIESVVSEDKTVEFRRGRELGQAGFSQGDG